MEEIKMQTIINTMKEIDKRSSFIMEQANLIRQRLHGIPSTPIETTNTDNVNDELGLQLMRLNYISDILFEIQERI